MSVTQPTTSQAQPAASRVGTAGRIEIDHVEKFYTKVGRSGQEERVHALRETNLVVEPGEFVGLVGPSGCGKTTLLRLIAGLIDRQRGGVRSRPSRWPACRTAIAMVFQHFGAAAVADRARATSGFGLSRRPARGPSAQERVAA